MTDDKDDKNENLNEFTKKVLAGLTAHEAKTLRKRFGIDKNNNISLDETGKQYDITRERIKEIERKALEKLKGNKNDDK